MKMAEKKMTEKQIKDSRAAYKAARTRKLNAFQKEYDAATSAGIKSAIKRNMNILTNTALPV